MSNFKNRIVMKRVLCILLVLSVSFVFSQETPNIEITNDGNVVIATYYHDNGAIEQQGPFNKQGELHGIWTSYDDQGNKVCTGNYQNGQKTGKWMFWTDTKLKEVEYINSQIVSVNEWSDKVQIAISN